LKKGKKKWSHELKRATTTDTTTDCISNTFGNTITKTKVAKVRAELSLCHSRP